MALSFQDKIRPVASTTAGTPSFAGKIRQKTITPQVPVETPQTTNLATGALDVAKGFGKAATEAGIGIVQGLGSLGTGALAAITPSKSWKELTEERQKSALGTPMEGLVRGTPEAERQKELLKATNPAQIGGKAAEWVAEAFLTGGTSMATKAESKLATGLNEASLRVTGATLRDFGQKVIKNVANTLTKYRITGNPEQRLEAITKIEGGFEKIVQDTLERAKDLRIYASKSEIIKQLQNLKKGLSGLRDRTALESQIDGAISEINRFKEKVPLWQLNLFKRSTMEGAYNKVGTKVNDEIEYKIADVVYDNLQNAANKANILFDGKKLADFNADYKAIVQTRKLLKLAIGKPEVGMLAKILSFTVGSSLGFSTGGPLGMVGGVTASSMLTKALGGTAAKSTAAKVLEFLSEKGSKLGKGIDTLKTLLK